MDSREQTSWVFRHIGPPPTIAGAAEVVELKQGATTFGRGGSSDVYIDSLLLHNFISRCHAVVVGEWDDDGGQLRFVLHNHGLNGTYVNDVRIGKIHNLREGDKIIFGHKNGYKVKVGETAEQPDSEFQFIFERCQPSKAAVTPLQEHRRQEEICGDTILSSGDSAQPSVYTPRRNGPYTPEKKVQALKESARKREKSGQRSITSEGHSGSPSRSQPEEQKSNPSKAGHASGPGNRCRELSGAESPEQKSETNHRSPQENCVSHGVFSEAEERSVAKENRDRSKSPWRKKSLDEEKKLQTGRPGGDDTKTVLSSRLAGVDRKSELPRRPDDSEEHMSSKGHSWDQGEAYDRGSSGCISTKKEIRRSASPKQEQSEISSSSFDCAKSKSPKDRNDRKALARASDHSGSPRYRGRSRSPKQLGRSRLPSSESSEHRSRSPLRKESTESRCISPEDKVLDHRSKSSVQNPKSGKSRSSRSPKPRRRSVSSASESSQRSSSSDSSSSSGSSSRSPKQKRRSSSSVYDEPPVLSPEYVVKTPSLCGFIGQASDEEYDEIDDMDKESLLYSVPPTPGHSLRDLSPSPHHSKRDLTPEAKTGDNSVLERSRDRSPYSVHQSRSRAMDAEFSRNQTRKTGKRSVSRSPKNQNRLDDRSVERDSFFNKSRRKGEDSFSDKKVKKNIPSRTEHEHAEPDSTTVHKDHNGVDVDSANSSTRGKDRSDQKCSEDKHKWHDGERDAKKSALHRSYSRDEKQRDYQNKAKGKSKDSSLPTAVVGRNVFDEFSSSDQHDSGQHLSGKKRQHSSELQASGDGSSKPRFKSSKPHQKPYKSFGEKENGPTPGKDSSDKHTEYAERNREKQQSDGKLLKDVRVSVQRVGTNRTDSSKHRGTDSDRKKIQSKSKAEDGIRTYHDQNKQPSQPANGEKNSNRGDKLRRDLSTDSSLFGLEMERLSSVQRKDRNKKPRDKTLHAKEEKLTSSRNQKDKKDKLQRKLSSDKLVSERSREKTRQAPSDADKLSERKRRRRRSVSSRSVTPDPLFSSEETDKSKPGRKVAMRRPRQAKEPHQEERKPGRSSGKKQKQPRKTTKSKDNEEDDECLEDGVMWYEEDTCESVHCFRPADRRVQWVCCDDCDKWYHTVCVGIINLDDLKDEDYHCGCTDE